MTTENLIEQLNRHLQQLAPHVKERETGQLLKECAYELAALAQKAQELQDLVTEVPQMQRRAEAIKSRNKVLEAEHAEFYAGFMRCLGHVLRENGFAHYDVATIRSELTAALDAAKGTTSATPVPASTDEGRQVKPHRSGGGAWVEPFDLPFPGGKNEIEE